MTSDLMETPEQRIASLGISLPSRAPSPIGSFCNVRRSGDMIYVSGQGPVQADGTLLKGKVGSEVTADTARDHAERR